MEPPQRGYTSQHTPNSAPNNTGFKLKIAAGCVLLIGIVILLAAVLLPWPHYQYAQYVDTPQSYRAFAKRFPQSDYAKEARERRHTLIEAAGWESARGTDTAMSYQNYVQQFPNGEHHREASQRFNTKAEKLWADAVASRSMNDVNAYLDQFPRAAKDALAQELIASWYRDWTWVREQDTIPDYNRFLELVPNHSHAEEAKARVIELEIEQIAAGSHGTLSPTAPTRRIPGATSGRIVIENATSYTLTVRYSGPAGRRIVIAPRSTRTLSVPIGTYRVSASVAAANVQNYLGSEQIEGAEYEVTYYID